MADEIQRLPLPKGCACCDDDGPLYMVGRCHPGAAVDAVLAGNILTLECADCKEVVTRFEVTCQIKM
jgi:hypothetical protein